MLTPKQQELKRQKYDDRESAPTLEQIQQHLSGALTIAVPTVSNDLACMLPLDVDSDALSAVPALLQEAACRGYWAFGQVWLKPGNDPSLHTGYVWLVFDRLTNADRLQALGEMLIHAVQRPEWKKRIESRAHGADTRLPFALHKHVNNFGLLFLPGIDPIAIDDDRDLALVQLLDSICVNTVDQLPHIDQPQKSRSYSTKRYSIIDQYNRDNDIEDLLLHYGAKRVGSAYLCPFHDDRNASLVVYTDRNRQKVAHCLSRHSACPLSIHGRYDSFNVYCIGERVTPQEAIAQLKSPGTPRSRLNEQPRINSSHCPSEAPQKPIERARKDQSYIWRRDPQLHAFIAEHGSTGALILHQAREKLGEDATNCQINAEIRSRRGRAYNERHLRRLNTERKALLERYYALKSSGATGHFDRTCTLLKELSIACEGGQNSAERQAVEQAHVVEQAPVEQLHQRQAVERQAVEQAPVEQLHQRQAVERQVDDYYFLPQNEPNSLQRGLGTNTPPNVNHLEASYNPDSDWTLPKLATDQVAAFVAGLQERSYSRPPTDPRKRATYFALLGKARKVERSNPKQAHALRMQARHLEEISDLLYSAIDPRQVVEQAPVEQLHQRQVVEQAPVEQLHQRQAVDRDPYDPKFLINQGRGIKRIYRASFATVPPPHKP